MKIPENDRSVLRKLAERVAEIAALPVHKEKADLWRRLNNLEKVRPLVWINEIPWPEMDVNGELQLQTTEEFCRAQEWRLRTTIYQWEHMRGDMVVEPVYYSGLVINDTGFGMAWDTDIIQHSAVAAQHYNPQIREEKDIEKIKTPVITYDEDATKQNYQRLIELFGDILPVEKVGIVHQWFAPWDLLVTWCGVQEALMDLVLRPEMVHKAVSRLVDAYLARLDQLEKLNLLSMTEGNYRVGSGGLGYTDELPQPDFDPAHVRPIDQWGCATPQIFSDVSPEMHEEFALQYERRWLERFGLTYYGCCEPLHNKLDILKSVPNLRKISMSPWADLDKAAGKMEGKYIISYKPSPAILATGKWSPERARNDLREALEKIKGCVVEVIMKDISTVCNEPQRLWEWADIAMEVVGQG